MKVLWHSNSPLVPSGYGEQTRIFAPRVHEAGHQVTISAFWGLMGSNLPAAAPGGVEVLGAVGHDPWGCGILEGHAQYAFGGNQRSGVVFTLVDVWVMDPDNLKRLNVASWVPVDHQPTPPQVTGALRASKALPVAMSKFGHEQLLNAGFKNALYVPHGVETGLLAPMDRAQAREVTGLGEDAFLVTMVAANRSSQAPTRKGFEIALQAFRIFMDRHDDAYLWLHCDLTGREAGLDLGPLMGELGYPRGKKARHRAPAPYDYATSRWTKGHLAALYNASDVLLCPSMGEGFGIPIIEAQACGTPVIVSDFSAMPELVGAGWKLGGRKVWTNFHAWQWDASIDDCVDALEEAYAARGDETLRKQAREFALDYDADKVFTEHMLPAFDTIQRRFGL